MKIELDLSDHHEAMFDELEELPETDAKRELADILEPYAEKAIHDAYQYHRQNGTL